MSIARPPAPTRRRASLRVASLAVGAAALGLIGAAPLAAQDKWPTRPIRMVVPYPPGGNSDLIGRFMAERLSAALGQQVVVENKGGGGGAIGAEVVANAAPDGYTILMAPSGVLVVTPHLRKVPYDPMAFVPIATISGSYGIVSARRDLPANSLAELGELAKKEPGKLTFGSAGPGTMTQLTCEVLATELGAKMTHVPYRGSAPSLNDLVGGRIDVLCDPIALAQIKAGAVKPLATTGAQRHPELPQVPTLKEAGLSVAVGSWFAFFAPKGTPAAAVDAIAAATGQVVAMPDTRARLQSFSQYPDFTSGKAFADRVRADSAFYRDLLERLGMTQK